MGLNEVYKSLQELFPEIDARVLRAVSIEHSEDVDAAVASVLEDIIPFFVEMLGYGTPLTSTISAGGFSEGDDSKTQLMIPEKSHDNQIKVSASLSSPGEPIGVKDKMGADARHIEVLGDPATEEAISGDNCPESITKVSSDNTPCQTLGTLPDVDMHINQKMKFIQESKELSGNLETDCCTPSNKENDPAIAFVDGNNVFDRMSSPTVTISTLDTSAQSVDGPDMPESNVDKLGASMSTDTASRMATVNIILGTKDVSTSNASTSQSSQILSIDALEEVIALARNNKRTLFSAMESIISLMRKVEVKEEAADKAKEDAAKGGIHILDKAEELKQILQHAKEANDMHSGEVYGEKAILATELRELQTGVVSLLDEKDKALGVLDKMNQTLKERLSAADNVISSKEQEKLEKEEAAQKLFADLELVMEKVVQESKTLEQQAEANSKLQEFLLDRGRAVDMIQGELAVICQDVRQLKEKFDNGVPFSKSLFSSHTSFILASSSSSSKTFIPEQLEPIHDGDDLVQTQEGRDNEQVPEEETPVDGCNALLEDGWDIFDKHEINA